MRRIRGVAWFSVAVLWTAAAAPAIFERDGWKLTADSARNSLIIAHDSLGTVLESVTLHASGGQKPLKGWTAEAKDGTLRILTASPRGEWVFSPGGTTLAISATAPGSFLKGQAPAPESRIVARLLDPEGKRVEWKGTDEVKTTYGGSETVNPSFLPRRNPECMHFALGPAPGAGFHSLFDRKTNTAIDFPADSAMTRVRAADANLEVRIPVAGSAQIRLIPDYYTKVLGAARYVPFDDSRYKTAPIVWCSWTSYYTEVTERAMAENTDWIAEHLKPYGFEYVQLDDGYDVAQPKGHFWIENWNEKKFLHGPEHLAKYIKSKGLRPGLWLVPNAYAGYAEEHPGWYVKNRQGGLIEDYRTPALDSTNPNSQAFLRRLFSTLKGWGFEYYKFDGEFPLPQYAPQLDRDKLHDKTIDPLVAYQQRLALIREMVGPETFIEGCPAGTPLDGIGTFDSCFTGADLYANWQGMYPLFSSIGANAFLNHIVFYVMPGEGIEIGPRMSPEEMARWRVPSVLETMKKREQPLTGLGVTDAEARTLVSHVALSGVVYPVASVMNELPKERARLLKMTMPTAPILPVDLFSRGADIRWDTFRSTTADNYAHDFPEILDLKVNAKPGVYDVVALTNWRGKPVSRELDFAAKLGLDPNASYAIFDFWAQRTMGVYRGRIPVAIAPHDTRVLLIHPAAAHPQLLGISRHITGAYSVDALAWNDSKRTLRGVAATVEGDPYTLWIRSPGGLRPLKVEARTAGREVPVEQKVEGETLIVTFPGQKGPVEWAAFFPAR